VGFVAIAGTELCTNQGFQSLIPKESVIAKFLMFWIQENRSEFDSRSAGSTFKEISKSNVKSMRILLPPLAEQKRIVDLISSVDSYIEALQQQVDKARKSRNAVLHDLLAKGGKDWVEITLEELISHSIGGIWGEEPGNSEIDVSIYRQTEFTDAGILVTPAEAVRSITKNQLNSRTLQFGDILIQKSAGTPSLPGRVIMVQDLNGEVASFSNFLNLLRPDTTKCLPRIAFLFFWLKHKEGKAFEYQRGTNIKNLDLPSYLQEKVNLPPLPEQKRIVELISVFDNQIEVLDSTIAKTKNLRSALLSSLLSGNHEIPTTYDKLIGAA
jgi:type I restriction enzyme S subunit